MHMTPPRWTSQEPSNVAAISPFAVLRDGEVSFWTAYDTIPLGLPRSPRGDSFTIRSPQGRRSIILVCI